MTLKTRTLFFISAIIALGCIENTAYVTQERSDKVADYILKADPKIQYPLNIDMDGKIECLGYDLKADAPKPGSNVEITWYWKVKKELGPGWRLFTHCIAEGTDDKLNRDTVGPVRQSFQPEHWRAGMIIKDQQSFRIPKDWGGETMDIRVGIWKGAERLKGRTGMDSANRVKGPQLKLTVKPKKPPVTVAYAAVAPKIDGKFKDEAAWQSATSLGVFVDTMKSTPVKERTETKIMWDEKNLYIAFTAEDTDLKSQYTKHDDELWHEDAFEMFVDPRADKKDYYELQVSPKGITFDSYLPKYRKNQNDWSSNMIAAVQVNGTVNDDSNTDTGWSGEIAVPFEAMQQGGGIPPKAGDIWTVNFFRIDAGNDKTSYSGWSPPMRGDFHTLGKFGRILFGKEGAASDADAAVADKKPADKKPADEKPADEKPADEKPKKGAPSDKAQKTDKSGKNSPVI